MPFSSIGTRAAAATAKKSSDPMIIHADGSAAANT